MLNCRAFLLTCLAVAFSGVGCVNSDPSATERGATSAATSTTAGVLSTGELTTSPPPGTAPTSGAPGTATAGSPTTPLPVTPVAWINSKGELPANSNTFGVVGSWYAFADGVTSKASGNPYRDGKYCVTGTAPGDGDYAAHWGVGLGLDLNSAGGVKMPFNFKGKLTGFRIKLTGSVPATARVHFVTNTAAGTSPFIPVKLGESAVYSIADAQVPADWTVENAGERVTGDSLYSIQIMVPGAETAGAIDVCIEAFEPVNDATTTPVTPGGTYINRDGFITGASNTFGLQGPVYVIGDGKSTTQTGNPYKDGKYCVAGQFSGASGDWGAGIAIDLNKAAGTAARLPYAHKGKLGGFRIGLSGQTPGPARIQFNLNEPQNGDQPFLVAQLGTTVDYRISWAQVPSSWKSSAAGLRVGDSVYTVQLFFEGTVAGPFNVCIDSILPLTEAELGQPAVAATGAYKGFRSIDPARLKAEYDTWKARHYSECTDGTACIPRDEGDCISEGIGYGMLLSVAFDDKAAFDKLWKFYSNHKGSSGLMDWQAARCGATQQMGWATDGDLDVALALIQAGCKWGMTYEQDARTVIGNIKTSSLETCSNGKRLLKPGSFGGCNGTERQVDPSYLATGYFKVFATLTGDAAWTSLVDDSYSLLSTLQGKMNGLVPDWSDPSGTPPSGDRGQYGPDASRTPWRIATDYAWFGEARAVTFLDKVATYVEAQGGIDKALAPASNYRGGLAMSGIHKDAATAQRYTDAWLTTSVDDGTYYPGTLRPIYMLLLANQFPNACK